MTPSAILHAQSRAWNEHDLDAFLMHVHPQILYTHAELTLTGRDAYRTHLATRLGGTLSCTVDHQDTHGPLALLAVTVALDAWRGRALLTFVHEHDDWWLIGDATTSL